MKCALFAHLLPPPGHLLSQQGCQFANSPNSYMIDNRKPLSGTDYLLFFQVLVPPPTCHGKMPHAKKRHCLKDKNPSYSPSNLRQLESSLKGLGVARRGLWWRWRDRDMRKSFKRRKNVLEMFGNKHIIKRLHLLSYSKQAKNFTLPKNIITDFSLARVLCDLHLWINFLIPYLHCMRLRRITDRGWSAVPWQVSASLKIGT